MQSTESPILISCHLLIYSKQEPARYRNRSLGKISLPIGAFNVLSRIVEFCWRGQLVLPYEHVRLRCLVHAHVLPHSWVSAYLSFYSSCFLLGGSHWSGGSSWSGSGWAFHEGKTYYYRTARSSLTNPSKYSVLRTGYRNHRYLPMYL